jgi:hypothetical protein
VAQHEERFKAAKSRGLPLKFCKAHPASRAAPETQQMLQHGNFEDLKQRCSLAFSSKQNVEALHQTDGSRTFAWSKEVLERIGTVIFSGAKDPEAKQLHMAGWLCMPVFDLALASGDNASQTPGFESPFGTFGRSD